MTFRSQSSVLLLALTIWVAMQSAVLAHGVHAPMTPADGTTYSPEPGAGWWDVVYGSIQHNMTAMLEAAATGGEFGPYLSIV